MATIQQANVPQSTLERPLQREVRRDSYVASLTRRVPPGWWKYLLVISDAVLILVGFALAYFMRYRLQWFRTVDPAFAIGFGEYLPFTVALLIILPITFYFSNVYPYRKGRSLLEETYTIATATTVGMVVLIIVTLFFRQLLFSRLIFLYAAILVTLLLGVSRLIIQSLRSRLRRYDIGVERVLLIGAGDVGRMVMRTIAARPDYGYKLVGFLDDHPATGNTDIGPFKALGPVDNFGEVIDRQEMDSVIICLPWQSHRVIQRLLRICELKQVRALVVPDLFQMTKNQMQVRDLNGIPLISTREISIRGWNLVVKRVSDLTLATLLGLIVAPLALIVAAAIRIDSPGPIFYTQTRVGKGGKPFRCHKFRSMVVGAEEMRDQLGAQNEASGPLFKVRNDPRRTRVGRVMRRYSLDELPQLINVFRGEMSLVGPRPNLPEEVEQYQEWHKKRLSVSPGITGLWQVSGRSDLTFDEMVLLDIYYVENWNLALDLNILLRSVPAILWGRGAY